MGWKPQARAQRTGRPLDESIDPDKLAQTLNTVLVAVRQHSAAWPFLKPVDKIEVPDYYDHIRYYYYYFVTKVLDVLFIIFLNFSDIQWI